MTTEVNSITDQEFLTQFENQTLAPVYFDHLGHLRLAWLYLDKHNLEVAISLTCSGIKAYAESLGLKRKFHVTITCALVKVMAIRIEQTSKKSWSYFLEKNNDLVNNSLTVLYQYYSKELLLSNYAQENDTPPDLKFF